MALNITFSQAEDKVDIDDTVQYFEVVSMGFIFFPFLYLSVLDPDNVKTSTVCYIAESEVGSLFLSVM